MSPGLSRHAPGSQLGKCCGFASVRRPGGAAAAAPPLFVEEQRGRVFEHGLDRLDEGGGVIAVDDAVIEAR